MRIFGQILIGLGIVFIVLGLADFVLGEIWEPRPSGFPGPQTSPGGIVGVILALMSGAMQDSASAIPRIHLLLGTPVHKIGVFCY